MKFTINTLNDNGSGMKFKTMEELLEEIRLMIKDCINNGGTYFHIDVDSDVSCFYKDEDDNESTDNNTTSYVDIELNMDDFPYEIKEMITCVRNNKISIDTEYFTYDKDEDVFIFKDKFFMK